MSEVQVTNVSNGAAFGAEWRAEVGGARYQLVCVRGGVTLTLSVKPSEDRPWQHWGPVTSPERFGMTEAPKSDAEFMKIARAFVGYQS